MKNYLIASLLAALSGAALADNSAACTQAAGSYMTGTVTSAPTFARGRLRQQVALTHSVLYITADADGQNYQVAIDNVFAAGYASAGNAVPAPINTIQVGDKLELCGQKYSDGTGIHWVHTNCNIPPTSATPNGWVKKFNADGSLSDSFTNSPSYCYLWPQNN